MANIQDYQNQAASIYDPQLQAELASLTQKKQRTLAGLADEERTIEPEYQRAIRGLGDQVRESEGRINQLYSQRLGGQFSGLQGNDLGMMYSKAHQSRGDIETNRANKLASIASRRRLAEEEELTGANALRSRYSGLKTQYAQQAYQRALEQEENRRRWEEEMSLNRQRAAASSAPQMPSINQFLVQAFSGYKPAYEGGTAYYTEREIIPALMANYGLSERDAANLAYEYRKRTFGEGYGSVGR